MRVVSYNILDGGEGRADPIAEILLAQRADVIAIVESDNAEVLDRLAQRLDMDFVVANTEESSVALFSRWTIVESSNLGLLNPHGPRAFLKALVESPDGTQVPVGVVHLHSRAFESDEQIRERQVQVVLQEFATERKRQVPHLLMGDFNANSPVQQLDPSKLKPKSLDAFHAQGDLPRRVVQILLDAEYVDSLHAANPSLAQSGATFTTQHSGQRVDYIFVHGLPLHAIRTAWIETDRLAKYASDHFPVGAEIELNP